MSFPHTNTRRCWAEIDTAALLQNLEALPVPVERVMAVVKANAYGHGIELVAPALAGAGVRHFGIATLSEGLELRGLLGGFDASIYVMTALTADMAEECVAANLIPLVSDRVFAEALSREANSQSRVATMHIEVDTGIGRAGVQPSDLAAFADDLLKLPNIRVTGICTHFTAADSGSGPDDATSQYAAFEKALSSLDPDWLATLTVHAANSPGILRVAAAYRQLIRPGLLLYGIAPSQAMLAEGAFPYSPVLSLKARVILARNLPAGSDISYSRTYRLEREATVLTIGIGYGDGYPRRLSNRGHVVLLDGTIAPIRGRICMDQICVELPGEPLTELQAASMVGATVTLIGGPITAGAIAEMIDATPHEVTTCLLPRASRVLV